MIVRLADCKGRLALGSRFAGCIIIVNDDDPNQIILKAVPAHEAWLFKSQKAVDLVRKGLDQARARRFSNKPPVPRR